MKKYIKNLIIIILSIVFMSAVAIITSYLIEPSIYDFYTDIEITKQDRILILAPHPDDEAISAGGVIQKALSQDAKVKVVCITNGDNNQLAYLF